MQNGKMSEPLLNRTEEKKRWREREKEVRESKLLRANFTILGNKRKKTKESVGSYIHCNQQ